MRRRDVVGLIGVTVGLLPLGVRAQQSNSPSVGFLGSSTLDSQQDYVASFHRGLNDVGYFQGRNIAVDYRMADDHSDRLPTLAADLVSHRVAVIATFSNVGAALAAKSASQNIPLSS